MSYSEEAEQICRVLEDEENDGWIYKACCAKSFLWLRVQGVAQHVPLCSNPS